MKLIEFIRSCFDRAVSGKAQGRLCLPSVICNPLTDFERRLRSSFSAYHQKPGYSALMVILTPSAQNRYSYTDRIVTLPDHMDPWIFIRHCQDMGHHVPLAFDLTSDQPLEEQFTAWLPGTINLPSVFIAKPVHAIPPDVTSPIGKPAIRHKEGGLHVAAPLFIRGVIDGGKNVLPQPTP